MEEEEKINHKSARQNRQKWKNDLSTINCELKLLSRTFMPCRVECMALNALNGKKMFYGNALYGRRQSHTFYHYLIRYSSLFHISLSIYVIHVHIKINQEPSQSLLLPLLILIFMSIYEIMKYWYVLGLMHT